MMPDPFKNLLSTAGACAATLGHSAVSVSHLAYVLSTSGSMRILFDRTGGAQEEFESRLAAALTSHKAIQAPSPENPEMGVTAALSRCIERAELFARSRGDTSFRMEDIIIEVFQEDHGTLLDNIARHLFAETRPAPIVQAAPGKVAGEHVRQSEEPPISEAAAQWTVNLVKLAAEGRIDEAYGRDFEIERLSKSLSRRKKNNAVLVGEPGVGKTAVVEGLALRIARGTAPPALQGKVILALDSARLVGGTGYRGDLEQRVRSLVDALQEDPRLILFIDEIHVITGGGSQAFAGVAEILKPALASGAIRCIGATTFDEYDRYFAKDMAMVRRFQEIQILEPAREAAIAIVSKAADSYGAYHAVAYDEEAVTASVDLTTRFILDRHLPDKALDALDEAGARARAAGKSTVGRAEVVHVIREMLNDDTIENADAAFWEAFEADIASRVAGQADAVSAVVAQIRVVSCHPSSRQGARAAFLFRGPEGAGKRHVARTLASVARMPVLELEMGTFCEQGSLNSLFGAPPGYVGHDEGGILSEFVKRNPTCLVFMHGLKSAHGTVREKIYDAMSKGSVMDGKRRTVSFRNAVVVVSEDEEGNGASSAIGFLPARSADRPRDAERSAFDRTVTFDEFDGEAGMRLVGMRVAACVEDYRKAGISIRVDDDVVPAVAAEGSRGNGAAGYVSAFKDMFESILFAAPPTRCLRVERHHGSLRAVDAREAA